MTWYAVLFHEPNGQPGGLVVRADHEELEGGSHRLFEEGRLVYQIPASRALRVERCPHHRAAEEFLSRHRGPLASGAPEGAVGAGGRGALHVEESEPAKAGQRSLLVETRSLSIAERILRRRG